MNPKNLVSLLVIVAVLSACAPTPAPVPTSLPASVAADPAEPTLAPTSTTEPTQSPPDLVKIGAQNLLSHMPLFIADVEGYYAEQNIVVEFVQIETGTEVLPLLAANDLDVVASALNIGLLNLMAQDDGVRIVADKGYTDPNLCTANAIMGRSDLVASGAFDTTDAVLNYAVLANPIGISGYALERWLEDTYDLTLDDIVVERLPRASQIDALNNGAASVVVASEPNITQFSDLAGVEILAGFQEYLPNVNYANILYGRHLRIDDTDLGQRFMVAYLKAVRQYMEGPTDRNIEIIAEITGLEPELLARACFPPIRTDGGIDYAATLEYMQWELDAGRIDVINTEDQFWDSAFVDFANAQLDQ